MCRNQKETSQERHNKLGRVGGFLLDLLYSMYRAARPLFGPCGCCRFKPTCSQYAYQAIRKYGFVKGGWLALKRLCRCHPFGGHGYDPVP